ncbi:DUF5709 domain-containing protein [Amycolatopsis rhabdoformis]|uniref:DUF5709 domain-containing protein n=1 Tax=Amycolatopsis rhabdoformis TaxID=1448059 RepID=A0ABZ1HXZ9_9PSEU|nr:DUF5709 domain-containing protein [Amycolatopsis rhabdoformis]WSE26496.1 DUF5709 domain-containing protein [Amycolatopsis rhabdoformis]
MDDDIEDNADTGVLDPEDTLEDGDPYDEGYSPPEKPLAVRDWGMTAAEELTGESWEGRLARELPDLTPDDSDDLGDTTDTDGELLDDEVGATRAGRLVAQDAGFGPDVDDELYASDAGIDGGAASAEEAAVHIVVPRD